MKYTILTAAAIATFAAVETKGDAKVDFAKQIQPIFEQSCIKCHGPEKQKGGLRLDNNQAALKGGTDTVSIVPGDVAKSDLYRRIILPAGSDDVMPNKGDLLTKAQTDLIKAWIEQGADWPESAVAKTAAAPEKTASDEPPKLPDFKPSAAELKAVAKLESMGVSIRPIAMNVNWHEANFRSLGTNSADAALVQLKDVLSLMDLNLSGAKFGDNALANIKGLTNLNHLHLEHTPVKDAGLENVKDLVNLTYLNLFDTAITDAGLESLKGLTHLQHLHVWQTKVTEAGVTNLQKILTNCNIVRGWDLTATNTMAKKEDPTETMPKKKKKKDK